MNSRVQEILDQVELDYIEKVEGDLNKRRELLPLTEEHQVKAIIWNLLTDDKYRGKISYEMYSEIIEELLNRVVTPDIDYDVTVNPPKKSYKMKMKIKSIEKFVPKPVIE